MTLKHEFNCAIADDPAATAAGEVTPSKWNAAHVIDDGLEFPAESPTAPADNVLKMFGKNLGGRMMAAFRSSTEGEKALQVFLGRGMISWWTPNIGANTYSVFGAGTASTVGTLTAAAPSFSGSKVLAANTIEQLVTTAATTAVASFRSAVNGWARGSGGKGGFFHFSRMAPATGCSNTSMRYFQGVRVSPGAPTDAEPSTITNGIGIGWDSADTNCQIIHNDGSGTATKIDMGESFSVPVSDRSVLYDLYIYAPTDSSNVYVLVEEVGTGASFTATLSTDLVAQTTSVTPWCYASVGGVSSVVGLKVGGIYMETLN